MTDVSIDMAAPDQDVGVSAYFTENLAAFREHAPSVFARLKQLETPHSRLFIDENGALDIALGDRRLYAEDAVTFTQRQIDVYFAEPERRYIESLGFETLGGLEGKYKKALAATLECEGVDLAYRRVDKSSHFTVVFGLGLGLHIDPLIEFSACSELIIVEPNLENLYHSLFVIDWRKLFERAADGDFSIHMVFDKNQESIASHLRALIRFGNPVLLDGVYIYQHYGSSLLTQAHRSFHRDYSLHLLGLGFFEDELTMMANAVGNLMQENIRVMRAQQMPRTDPVIICGSGPSIDDNLELIAAQSNRAIIVSIGSSLRTLLAHGIRPDMHVETENHPANAANIERAAEEFGLSGITLLGASTVQPIVTELFDDVIFYHRERQSPAVVFGKGMDHMGTAGPTVANAALVTLLHLGFREVYLFGIDMGSRQSDKYHSSDTYIGLGESKEWAGDARAPVSANFGGKADAETILNWSRAGLEDVLSMTPGVRCVNCSDGARIAGTIPMLPRVFDLQNQPIDHIQVMREVRENMPLFPIEVTAQIWANCEMADVLGGVFSDIDTLLASADQHGCSGVDWVHDLYDLLDSVNAKSPVLSIFLFGTTCLFLGSFWWFDGRIEDFQVRNRFRPVAKQELRGLFRIMEQRLTTLIRDVGQCIDGTVPSVDSSLKL